MTLPTADRRADDEDGEGSAGIVVFPSNRESRSAPIAWRRRRCADLACLVDAGLIIRRDSPMANAMPEKGRGEIENALASI